MCATPGRSRHLDHGGSPLTGASRDWMDDARNISQKRNSRQVKDIICLPTQDFRRRAVYLEWDGRKRGERKLGNRTEINKIDEGSFRFRPRMSISPRELLDYPCAVHKARNLQTLSPTTVGQSSRLPPSSPLPALQGKGLQLTSSRAAAKRVNHERNAKPRKRDSLRR